MISEHAVELVTAGAVCAGLLTLRRDTIKFSPDLSLGVGREGAERNEPTRLAKLLSQGPRIYACRSVVEIHGRRYQLRQVRIEHPSSHMLCISL